MEKYGVADSVRLDGLKKEEARLMGEMAQYHTFGMKTASEREQVSAIQERLDVVRATITEMEIGPNLVQG